MSAIISIFVLMKKNDIIYAPATVAGTGAISIIRISGDGCLELSDRLIHLKKGLLSQAEGYSLHFGSIYSGEELLDEVLVSIFRAPRSYTGEDSVEISCHSSAYIVSEILHLLSELGGRLASPGEFTQRAFLNGKMDLAQAEAVAELIAADSKAAHRVASKQLKGEYSQTFRELRDKLQELAALLELELDFSEEEVEFADRGKLKELAYNEIERLKRLCGSFRLGNALKNGVPVAIVGAPNVGKSTLLNALLGQERAIVSETAGTTRDTVEESIVIEGVRYRFIDTAGLRQTEEVVEKMGIERSLEAVSAAQIVIALLEDGASEENDSIRREILSRVDLEVQKIIWVYNKSDLNRNTESKGLRISALEKENLEGLLQAIKDCALASEVENDTIVCSERHYAALKQALESMERLYRSLDLQISEDLLAQDLREAIASLNSIFASVSERITSDSVLGEVFGRFCIGK